MTSAFRTYLKAERDRLLRERGVISPNHDDTRRPSTVALEQLRGDGCRVIRPLTDPDFYEQDLTPSGLCA